MSIVVNIKYKGEYVQLFCKEMVESGIVHRIREQAGNLRYEYYTSFENEEEVLLVDAWKNQAALDRHHSSEMMNEIIQLRDKYNLEMTVTRYIEANDQITDNDQKYII